MKYIVTLKYPSGYRYRKEIDCVSPENAVACAEGIRRERNAGFDQRDNMEWVDYVTVESVVEKKAPTVKDVLLNRLNDDPIWLARIWLDLDENTKEYIVRSADGKGTEIARYMSFSKAIEHQIAYLNSPAEVEK